MSIANADEVKEALDEFQGWAKKYAFDREVGVENAVEVSEIDGRLVWTEFYFGEYFFLAHGFTAPDPNLRAPVSSYFVCRQPWIDDTENLLTSKEFTCEECFGDGEDADGDECPSCDGEASEWVDFNDEGAS